MITSTGGKIISAATVESEGPKDRHQISKLWKKGKSICRIMDETQNIRYRSTAHPTNQAHLCCLSKGTAKIVSFSTASTAFFNSAKARKSSRCLLISCMPTKGAAVVDFPMTNRVGGQ